MNALGMIGALDSRIVASTGGGILPVVLVILVAVGSLIWHFTRSRSILEKWAERSGYEILESDYRNLVRGPFFWTSSKGQTVYRVKVRDRLGNIRSGWVRCGGWFSGLLSDATEVKWES